MLKIVQKLDVQPIVLVGKTIRLEPLSIAHIPALSTQADPGLFRFFGGTVIEERGIEAVSTYVNARLSLANTVSFAMVLQDRNEAVGHSSYMSIRPPDRVLEIGATWIGKAYQGTRVNPEAKLLMIQHAFEVLGCVRVELKTDERNLQSQHAMEKLGLIREGVLRKHSINADGYIRNVVYYSVIEEEWPAMKDRLQTRLANL